ncbi:unnamed protein product [Eretmochelys imbricata]
MSHRRGWGAIQLPPPHDPFWGSPAIPTCSQPGQRLAMAPQAPATSRSARPALQGTQKRRTQPLAHFTGYGCRAVPAPWAVLGPSLFPGKRIMKQESLARSAPSPATMATKSQCQGISNSHSRNPTSSQSRLHFRESLKLLEDSEMPTGEWVLQLRLCTQSTEKPSLQKPKEPWL